MSSIGMSQKEYLKKYLSAGSDDKKKKKKKTKTKPVVNRLRIVDDDIDIHNMRPLDEDELDLYELQEDAPQIAGIIDERPEEVQIKEKYGSKKWKVVADENDMGIKIIDKSNPKGALPSEHISLAQGKNDEDLSPLRKGNKYSDGTPETQKMHDSGSLPSRRNCQRPDSLKRESDNSFVTKKSHRSDSDESPPRKSKRNDSDESPPRRSNKANLGGFSHHRKVNNFADESPPYKSRKSEWENSRHIKKRDNYNSDISPSRKNKADNSPPRRRQQNYDSDESSPRRKKKGTAVDSFLVRGQKYDSDESPPRRDRKNNSERAQSHKSSGKNYSDESPARRNRRNSRTPPRKDFIHKTSQKGRKESPVPHVKVVNEHRRERQKSDSDESPPRRQRRRDSMSPPNKGRRRDSFSPVRREKERKNMSQSPVRNRMGRDGQEARRSRWADNDVQYKERYFGNSGKDFDKNRDGRNYSSQRRRDPEESPERRKQATPKEDSKKDKTLDGRKAGLVGAGELKAEIEDLRQREKEMFEKMDVGVSGRGAAPIMRDRKTGKKRDLEEEAREKKEKNEKQAERDAKYMQWGKGLKQVSDKAQKMEEDLYEMSKPLARYADDADLDKYLRHQEREGDPMLDYIRSKNKSEGDKSKARYEGSFMPNRFGIRPGYRWDGVDRSNGYEKQWFETQNAKKAVEEEAYKWSTADM